MDSSKFFKLFFGFLLVFGMIGGSVFGSDSSSEVIFKTEKVDTISKTNVKEILKPSEVKYYWVDKSVRGEVSLKGTDKQDKVPSGLISHTDKKIAELYYSSRVSTNNDYSDVIERYTGLKDSENLGFELSKEEINSMTNDRNVIVQMPGSEAIKYLNLNDDLIASMNNCDSSGFFGSAGCLLKPKIDGSTIGIKAGNEAASSTRNKCSQCSTDDFNKMHSAEFDVRAQELGCESIIKCDLSKLNEEQKSAYEALKNIQDKTRRVDTNIAYDIISVLANPDGNAMKASKLFGFDEKFNFKDTTLYEMFGEPFASKICLAKIDGYLDNEQNNGGGVTKYKFSGQETEFGTKTNSVDVLYDLRAQRTQMTPDGKSVISYSYFLRAPKAEELTYIIAISYVGNNQLKKLALTDMKTVKGGSTGNGFESVEVPLNSTTVDEGSFQIGLVAVGASKQPYYSVTIPIVLIGSGDSYSSISSGSGNSAGNAQAQAQAASSNFGVNDMLGMMG